MVLTASATISRRPAPASLAARPRPVLVADQPLQPGTPQPWHARPGADLT
jgi:hypothetical protein